jgi:hypothetical protein
MTNIIVLALGMDVWVVRVVVAEGGEEEGGGWAARGYKTEAPFYFGKQI